MCMKSLARPGPIGRGSAEEVTHFTARRFGYSACLFQRQDARWIIAKVAVGTVVIVRVWSNAPSSAFARTFRQAGPGWYIELLASYSGPESDGVRWGILELSKASSRKIGQFVKAAQSDYREILYGLSSIRRCERRGRRPKTDG